MNHRAVLEQTIAQLDEQERAYGLSGARLARAALSYIRRDPAGRAAIGAPVEAPVLRLLCCVLIYNVDGDARRLGRGLARLERVATRALSLQELYELLKDELEREPSAPGESAWALPELFRAPSLGSTDLLALDAAALQQLVTGCLDALNSDRAVAAAIVASIDRRDQEVLGPAGILEELLAPETADGLVQRASRREQRGDPVGAMEDLERAVALSPTHLAARQLRAELLSHRGDFATVVANCDVALAAHPGHVELLGQRARAQHRRGEQLAALADFDAALRGEAQPEVRWQLLRDRAALHRETGNSAAALTDLTDAIALCPDELEPLLARSLLLQRRGELALAKVDLDHAVTLVDGDPEIYYQRSNVRARLDDSDGALADLGETLRRAPLHLRALNSRGLLLAERAEWQRALADFDRALSLARDPALYSNRARVRRALGDWERAVSDLSQALADNPRSLSLLLDRADCYERLALRDGAVTDFLTVLRFADLESEEVELAEAGLARLEYQGPGRYPLPEDPYDVEVQRYLDTRDSESLAAQGDHRRAGEAAFAQGDYPAALQAYEAYVAAAPDFVEPYLLRGAVFAQIGDHGRARADYERARACCPTGSQVHLALADLCAREGNRAAALAALEQGLAAFPHSGRLCAQRGVYLLESEGPGSELARKSLAQAQELSPLDPQVAMTCGRALYAARAFDEAIRVYERVLALRPHEDTLRYQLALSKSAAGDDRGAERELAFAISTRPDFLAAYLCLAEVHERAGRLPAAFAALCRALCVAPADWEARASTESRLQAISRSLRGDPSTVRAAVRGLSDYVGRLIEAERSSAARALGELGRMQLGESAPLLALLGHIELSAAASVTTRALLDRALAIDPECAAVQFVDGEFAAACGDFARADVAYGRAIELSREGEWWALHRAWSQRGRAAVKRNDGPAAVLAYRRAVELEPSDSLSWTALGEHLAAIGELEAAAAAIDRALSLSPEEARAWVARAHIRLERADHAGALADLCEAGRLEPQRLAAARSDPRFSSLAHAL